MIRLSTAHAKARMSKAVELKDSEVAVELVQFAYFKKVSADPRSHGSKLLNNLSDGWCNRFGLPPAGPGERQEALQERPRLRFRRWRGGGRGGGIHSALSENYQEEVGTSHLAPLVFTSQFLKVSCAVSE